MIMDGTIAFDLYEFDGDCKSDLANIENRSHGIIVPGVSGLVSGIERLQCRHRKLSVRELDH